MTLDNVRHHMGVCRAGGWAMAHSIFWLGGPQCNWSTKET